MPPLIIMIMIMIIRVPGRPGPGHAGHRAMAAAAAVPGPAARQEGPGRGPATVPVTAGDARIAGIESPSQPAVHRRPGRVPP
jgi:hypothetical protein